MGPLPLQADGDLEKADESVDKDDDVRLTGKRGVKRARGKGELTRQGGDRRVLVEDSPKWLQHGQTSVISESGQGGLDHFDAHLLVRQKRLLRAPPSRVDRRVRSDATGERVPACIEERRRCGSHERNEVLEAVTLLDFALSRCNSRVGDGQHAIEDTRRVLRVGSVVGARGVVELLLIGRDKLREDAQAA
jgi:hypothetical protein